MCLMDELEVTARKDEQCTTLSNEEAQPLFMKANNEEKRKRSEINFTASSQCYREEDDDENESRPAKRQKTIPHLMAPQEAQSLFQEESIYTHDTPSLVSGGSSTTTCNSSSIPALFNEDEVRICMDDVNSLADYHNVFVCVSPLDSNQSSPQKSPRNGHFSEELKNAVVSSGSESDLSIAAGDVCTTRVTRGPSRAKLGANHQALIPEMVPKRELPKDHGTLMYSCDNHLKIEEVEEYEQFAQSTVGKQVRLDKALHLLHQFNYDLEKARSYLIAHTEEFLPEDEWSDKEKATVDLGFRIYGKDFDKIAKLPQLRSKSKGLIIDYYYQAKPAHKFPTKGQNLDLTFNVVHHEENGKHSSQQQERFYPLPNPSQEIQHQQQLSIPSHVNRNTSSSSASTPQTFRTISNMSKDQFEKVYDQYFHDDFDPTENQMDKVFIPLSDGSDSDSNDLQEQFMSSSPVHNSFGSIGKFHASSSSKHKNDTQKLEQFMNKL